MADDNEIPVLTCSTTLLYKSRGGECKELTVVQPLDPNQRKLDFKDLQILAREIANVLREDG
jgi:hypothetical protein